MKNRIWTLIVVATLTACGGGNSPTKAENRFIVLERFPMIHGDNGEIIQDQQTKECYLYLWGGAGNGGPSLANAPCPEKTNDDTESARK